MFSKAALAILATSLLAIPVQAQFDDISGISFSGNQRGTLATCTDFEYQQPLDPANFANAQTSDEEPPFSVAEAIVSGSTITPYAGGNTSALRVWAIDAEFVTNLGFVGPCTEDQVAMTGFNVNFYSDNSGLPAVAPSFSTTATVDSIIDTGVAFAFTSVFEYNLTLDTPAPEGYEWIEIVRQTGQSTMNGQCLWLWVNETDVGTYDNLASQNLAPLDSDQTLCIAAPALPVTEVPVKMPALVALIGLLGLAAVVALKQAR